MVDLIFTSDGKEYLTPTQLINEIKGELYDQGGRINLVELAKNIGVDLAHINAHLNEVLKGQKDIQHVLGQLIDHSYISRVAGEINEKLQQQGQISIGDLTIHYDLPAEFLQQIVDKNLGKVVFGKQDKNDPRIYYTESFIARTKAKIRGALAGLTRPTPVASILNQVDVNEKMFFSLFDQTCMYGTLTSRLPGAQYIPNVYARSQNEWVSNFYRQNGYLEYDALNRLGITDYKQYIKKQLVNEELHYLSSCIISKSILERVQADIDECIASKSYTDLQSNLPSVFNEKDIEMILNAALTNQQRQQILVIESYVISKAFVEKLADSCDELVKANAKATVESGKYQEYQISLHSSHLRSQKSDDADDKVDKREERRKKAASGKSGGGTQGRETKTRSTKKFNRGGNKNIAETDDDDDVQVKKMVLEVVAADEVRDSIQPLLEEESLDDLLEPLTAHLFPKLNEKGLEAAASIYVATVADRTANRRQTHNELQNKLNALIGDVRLFEKGTKLLPQDVQTQLVKYLLKSLCTDIVNEVLNYIAAEQNLGTKAETLNNDQKLKFVNELPSEFKTPLVQLVKSLSGQSIDDFMTTVEEALIPCSMILKKIDKKKDRTVVLNHKHQLLEQLNKCEDVALALHLATLAIFTTATHCMLHASGRHVTAILAFLKQYLTEEQANELTSYHDFVTLMLSGGSEVENAKEKLKEKLPVIKSIANEFKKAGSEK
ncbi:unnamed protein product [Acanthoscelides obtectus]|nr:unnamed protein product [Acanthoscelides obtectus]CAK1666586.1 E3 UFM1-protein ligase 1 homolog [Acanthoscelides obtectus]